MLRLALSLLADQAAISCRVRKQPRQVSLSSRQQARIQGDGTAVSQAVGCRSARSGIDIDAGKLRAGAGLAGRATAILAAAAVVSGARIEGDRQLLVAPLIPAPFAATPLPARCRSVDPGFTGLRGVRGRIAGHAVQPAGAGGGRAGTAQALYAHIFADQG